MATSYNQGFDAGYDGGFNKGYDQGHREGVMEGIKHTDPYQIGYEIGYEEARYTFAEQPVEAALPRGYILPEYPHSEIIRAGVENSQAHWFKLMDCEQVGERIREALNAGTPLSIVRLGDGELLTIAQEAVLSQEEVKRLGAFLDYAGVQVPDLAARDLVLDAMKKASIVGIPDKRMKTFQPLAFQVFQANQINYREMALCSSLINYQLMDSGLLIQLMHGKKTIIIGNMAVPLSKILRQNGVRISGIVDTVRGMKDISRVMAETAQLDFDLALVSAGVPAVVISQKIASELGKVAIDFGHVADRLIR